VWCSMELKRVRNHYVFTRRLTQEETAILVFMAGWRRESSITTSRTGGVMECVVHPDDMGAFLCELRRLHHSNPRPTQVREREQNHEKSSKSGVSLGSSMG